MSAPPAPADRRPSVAAHLLLALLAYVPILRTRPGVVAADTKSYLYLDPGRLLVRTPRGDVESWDVSARVVFVTKYNRALETGGTAPEGRDAK